MDMLKQFSIMCNHFQSTEGKCRDCPLRAKLDSRHITCSSYILESPDSVSAVVQEWFYNSYKVADLIDRTTLLKELRARWVNSNTAREDVLVYLDVEELIKNQVKVLPTDTDSDSTALTHNVDHSVDDDKALAKDVKTFKQAFFDLHPDARRDDDDCPKAVSLPCQLYRELEPCRKVCHSASCDKCWDTPMLETVIARRAQELASKK